LTYALCIEAQLDREMLFKANNIITNQSRMSYLH